MIFITSGRYVNPELQVEFGKIPPSFLPLGAKRLYEHQVSLFSNRNEKLVLSLPESYALEKSDELKLMQLGVQVVFVKDGLSLGQSVVFALNMLFPIEENISILHGDTLFSQLNSSVATNSIEISKVNTHYAWEYIVNNGELFIDARDTKEELADYVISGYFNFEKPYDIAKCITASDYSFSEGIKQYAGIHEMELVKNDHWYDFGLLVTFFHSKKSFTTERAFNSLSVSDGYVTKCSEKQDILLGEINWYQKISHRLTLYVPRFDALENNKCYRTEYLYLSALNELFVFGKLPDYVWKQIFSSTKDFLTILHSNTNDEIKVNFDYKQKTIERIDAFALDKDINLDKGWKLNNVKLPSIRVLVDELDQYLNNGSEASSFIHGDFCMSNIMYNFKSNTVKVYDPRGMDFDNKITEYGKAEYDNAKLMHSVLGLYDFIISDFYTLSYQNYELDFELGISNNILSIQKTYKDIFKFNDFTNLYAIMIHLFLSMLPLHSDNEKRQYALLANVYRLYIDLKGLNN